MTPREGKFPPPLHRGILGGCKGQIPHETVRVPRPVEEPEGDQPISGKQGEEEAGCISGHLSQPGGQDGVDPLDQGHGQQPPEKGIQGTNEAGEIPGRLGVVPEPDPHPPQVEGSNGIFSQGGQEAPGQEEGCGMGLQKGRHIEDGQGPQTIHRAQGEDEEAFAPMAAPAQKTCVEDFQKEAQEAVEEKFNKQKQHLPASLPRKKEGDSWGKVFLKKRKK